MIERYIFIDAISRDLYFGDDYFQLIPGFSNISIAVGYDHPVQKMGNKIVSAVGYYFLEYIGRGKFSVRVGIYQLPSFYEFIVPKRTKQKKLERLCWFYLPACLSEVNMVTDFARELKKAIKKYSKDG